MEYFEDVQAFRAGVGLADLGVRASRQAFGMRWASGEEEEELRDW